MGSLVQVDPFIIGNHPLTKVTDCLGQVYVGSTDAEAHLVNVLMVHGAVNPVYTHVSKEQETSDAYEQS